MPKYRASAIGTKPVSSAFHSDTALRPDVLRPSVAPPLTAAPLDASRQAFQSNVVTDIDFSGHRLGAQLGGSVALPGWQTVVPHKRPVQRTGYRRAKRALDIAGAAAGLLMLAPLLLGCAAAIKLTSPGPVFFRQNRYGLDGKLFSIYKFRTMRCDVQDCSGVQQTVKNDPRITPIGAFLRRSSFDELPQLLNVLNGTMSIVGPRPHVPNMIAAGVRYEDFDPRYMERHVALPGITGLAQVKGYRGETDTYDAARGRLDYDLEYTRTASFWGDVKIILGTLAKEFVSGTGY